MTIYFLPPIMKGKDIVGFPVYGPVSEMKLGVIQAESKTKGTKRPYNIVVLGEPYTAKGEQFRKGYNSFELAELDGVAVKAAPNVSKESEEERKKREEEEEKTRKAKEAAELEARRIKEKRDLELKTLADSIRSLTTPTEAPIWRNSPTVRRYIIKPAELPEPETTIFISPDRKQVCFRDWDLADGFVYYCTGTGGVSGQLTAVAPGWEGAGGFAEQETQKKKEAVVRVGEHVVILAVSDRYERRINRDGIGIGRLLSKPSTEFIDDSDNGDKIAVGFGTESKLEGRVLVPLERVFSEGIDALQGAKVLYWNDKVGNRTSHQPMESIMLIDADTGIEVNPDGSPKDKKLVKLLTFEQIGGTLNRTWVRENGSVAMLSSYASTNTIGNKKEPTNNSDFSRGTSNGFSDTYGASIVSLTLSEAFKDPLKANGKVFQIGDGGFILGVANAKIVWLHID